MPVDEAAERSALTIAKFDKALHDRSAFSCGFKPIDNFLKSSLSEQIKNGFVQAWIATEEGQADVLGFYTLGAMAVRAGLGPKKWDQGRAGIPDIPVIYIRSIAVHKDLQGQGYGTALVVDAMRRSLEVSEKMGTAAIVLDVLEDDHIERRWKFYEELGFLSLSDPDNPHRVYIPMADVRASFS